MSAALVTKSQIREAVREMRGTLRFIESDLREGTTAPIALPGAIETDAGEVDGQAANLAELLRRYSAQRGAALDTCEECGGDSPAEGQSWCLECLENGGAE